jgi:GT2 family glycosyltransferase
MVRPSTVKIGVVAIGRNEAERLDKCLTATKGRTAAVVYVDSGSTDGSVSKALRAGSDVIELDPRIPFTAARARNEGFERVRQLEPDLEYVQFVDGDCELVSGWIEKAAAFLDSHRDVAAVCGRRRERNPARSIYNMLCDIEWDTPIGEAKACGGDALVRVEALKQVGGFRADLIAAEDTELCVRLRAASWRIWRLDTDMTVHEAAMTRFAQWWRRAVRAGYCFAQGAYLHGAPPEQHFIWESRRAWLWGIWLPLLCLVAGFAFQPWGWSSCLIYPLQIVRLIVLNPGPLQKRALLAVFQVLARFPECAGQIKFLGDRFIGSTTGIIEYK